ncbi:MAG: hypothetical protein P4L66_12005 [Acetobacteraceae bacterium]|nr:hypothetical protein [Acetobacteraceae bacterium]
MAEISPEDLERLANRLAQLTGYDQDADNAGRAIGGLARRMGVSGDDLRNWLLAGALSRMPQDIRAHGAPDGLRMERALANSEHSLRVAEAQLRQAHSERDALKEENNLLIESLDRARSGEQVRRYVGMSVIAAAILGGAVLAVGPALRPVPQIETQRPFGSPFLRSGVVRGAGGTVYKLPQTTSVVVTKLVSGSRVEVRQTVERDQQHWVEVEVGGVVGYMVSTDLDVADPGLR